MMTGRDRSYLRAVRRSVIALWTPVVETSKQTPARKWVQSEFQSGKHYFHHARFSQRRLFANCRKPRWPELPLTSVTRTVERLVDEPEKQRLNGSEPRLVRLLETLANYHRSIASNTQRT